MKRFTRSFAVSVVGILFIIMRIFSLIWLGREYVNGTFTDEDIQNVDDIEEIQKLLDDTSEDEPCSE